MANQVKMYHKELDVTFMAPAGAVDHYKTKGWKVGDKPKSKPADKPKDKPKEDATD